MMRYTLPFSLLLLFLTSQNIFAFEIEVSDASASRGKSAQVNVSFSQNGDDDIYAVDLWFRYDHTALEIDRIEKGGVVSAFKMESNFSAKPGLAKVVLYGDRPLDVLQGDLVKFHFKVKNSDVAQKDYPFEVQRVKFNTDMVKKEAARIRHGKFTVSDKTVNE